MTPENTLAAKRCAPCEGGVSPLPRREVATLLAQIPAWRISTDGSRIHREWRVKDFVAGLDFFRRVSDLAEAEGHHPDLHLAEYSRVIIEICTHAANGLTENDVILAAKIDELPVELKRRFLFPPGLAGVFPVCREAETSA